MMSEPRSGQTKELKRKQAWHDKYALRLGLRPTERDEASGAVLAVQCGFCVVFGREPRDPQALPLSGKKVRARTSNVAKWVTPLRTDNVRNHLTLQHTVKWGVYSELLRRMRDGDGEAEQQIKGFFEDGDGTTVELEPEQQVSHRKRRRVQDAVTEVVEIHGTAEAAAETDNGSGAGALTAPVETELPSLPAIGRGAVAARTAVETQQPPLSTSGRGAVVARTAVETQPLLVQEIATPEIVETLVDGLYGNAANAADAAMVKQVVTGGPQGRQRSLRGQPARNQRTEKFVLDVENTQELEDVQRLLGIGLTIEQVVQTLVAPSLSADTVRSYARLSVAASLQMISTVMRRTWAYSIAFQVLRGPKDGTRTGGRSNAALELRVRLPMSRGADVADLHVIALPLPSFEQSPEQVTTFIERVLNILDGEWQSKLLGGCVNGAANELGPHAPLLDDILQQATSPCLYRIWRPAQTTEACLRSALLDLSGDKYSRHRENESFLHELVTLTTFLRGYEPWIRVYGRCPELDTECPWSSLTALEWVSTRRHSILEILQDQPYIQPPEPIFWLVCSVLIDVLFSFKDAAISLESFPLPSRIDCERILARCVSAIANKCNVSRSEGLDTTMERDMRLEGDAFHLGRFWWPRKAAMIPYLRSLNLSMRRLYDVLPSGDKEHVEWIVAGFVLSTLRSVAEIPTPSLIEASNALATEKTTLYDPPPTLPFDFVAIERVAAVDLVERYSERLEQAHGLAFLDSISNDIELLKSMATANPSFRTELEDAQLKSFRSAWECVPDLVSLRAFAAGLATALPKTTSNDTVLGAECAMAVAVALQERKEDQYRANFGDFAVEARLHMAQARIVQSMHLE